MCVVFVAPCWMMASPGRMEQRTYLLESPHLYSVADLRQVGGVAKAVVWGCFTAIASLTA